MDSNNINISFGLNVSIPPNILKNLIGSSDNNTSKSDNIMKYISESSSSNPLNCTCGCSKCKNRQKSNSNEDRLQRDEIRSTTRDKDGKDSQNDNEPQQIETEGLIRQPLNGCQIL